MIKLSIITSYYNCLEYTKELANVLQPQLTEDIEWIIIDDGCHEQELDNLNAIIIHLPKNSGCAGTPRNYGLDIAKGEYITFIDGDDIVSNNFISKILNKINTNPFDYCFMSWRKDNNSFYVDVAHGRPAWNCSVWGIIYNKNIIKENRFNNKRIAEDYDFNAVVLKEGQTKEIIPDFLYTYRTNENGICATYRQEENK